VRDERDRLRERAALVAQQNARVPLLLQEVAHLKGCLEEKLDIAGFREVLSDTQGFKAIMDEMKDAKLREAETKKAMVELKEQVKDITKEKETVVEVLEADNPDSDWQWMEVKNAYHSGDDVGGSGLAYTLQQAKEHAKAVQAAGFTQDRFLEHPEDTDGIFWFHATIDEASKLPRDTGRPDGMQSLFFRSEALIPKVRMWFDKQKRPVTAPSGGASGATGSNLEIIGEDDDHLSDHGSLGVSAGGNVSSIGDAEVADMADIQDFDVGLYGFDPVLAEARLQEEARLERELQEQLAEERVQKDKAADELAAYVGAKENALARLRERVEDNEEWRARAQQMIVENQRKVEHKVKTKEEAAEEERVRLAKKEVEDAAKERRLAELKQRISLLKGHFDESMPEWTQMRSLVAMAKVGKQVADMRVVDFQASSTAMENIYKETVNRLNADIAALRDPGAVKDTPSGTAVEVEAKSAPEADPAAVAEMRLRIAAIKQEIFDLAGELDLKEREHDVAKRAQETELAAQADRWKAAHENDVKELRSAIGKEVETLRISLAEVESGS
jgi:hypothetical protein